MKTAFTTLITATLLMASSLTLPGAAYAHGGRTAADGCHNDRKTGTRHCHGAKSKPAPRANVRPKKKKVSKSAYYKNCAAARAAGAAPVRRGDPGYTRHLDRDNDGIGCE